MARSAHFAIVLSMLAVGASQAAAAGERPAAPHASVPAYASSAVPPYDPGIERNRHVVVRSPRQVERSPLRDTVMNVQIALRIAEYYDGEIDGTINQDILDAVNLYRIDHPEDADAFLRQVIEGEQERLAALGLYEGEIDGLSSPGLYEAMIKADYLDSLRTVLPWPEPARPAPAGTQAPPAKISPPPKEKPTAGPGPGAQADPYGGDVPKAAPREGVVAQDMEKPAATPPLAAQEKAGPEQAGSERKRPPRGTLRL